MSWPKPKIKIDSKQGSVRHGWEACVSGELGGLRAGEWRSSPNKLDSFAGEAPAACLQQQVPAPA